MGALGENKKLVIAIIVVLCILIVISIIKKAIKIAFSMLILGILLTVIPKFTGTKEVTTLKNYKSYIDYFKDNNINLEDIEKIRIVKEDDKLILQISLDGKYKDIKSISKKEIDVIKSLTDINNIKLDLDKELNTNK